MHSIIAKNRGTILVFTLWVLAFVGVVAIGLTTRARLSILQAGWLERKSTANLAIDSLVALAIQRHLASTDNKCVDYNGAWAQKVEQSAADVSINVDPTPQPSRNYILRSAAVDESGKLNINYLLAYVQSTGNKKLLEQIVQLANGGAESATIANNILDWWDLNTEGPGEDQAYAAAEKNYGPPNSDFKQIDELRFVLGLTQQIYDGEDLNHNWVLDPEEDDGPATPPDDNQNGQLELGVKDYLTVAGGPELNINTVSGPLLQVLFSSILGEDGDQAARSYLAHRDGADRLLRTADDAPLRNIAELEMILSANAASRILNSGVDFGVSSSAFTHYFEIEFPAVTCTYRSEILVTEEQGRLAIASYQEN